MVLNSSDTCQMGVSLSKDLSSVGSVGFGDVGSSVTLSCWRAGVWGVKGASRGDGDGSVITRIGLFCGPGMQSSVGGTVCISR